MDLLTKFYLLTAENMKRAREGRDPAETTTQKNDLKVNDLVLVRDMTSGAFAPRYMPNYRVVAIHGPKRIVVRDEKGNETLRRASHLKVCDWKQKVVSMAPEQEENCRTMMIKGMVFRYTSTRGFIPKKIQWHIHAGSWSLVNCLWWEAFTRPFIRCS